LGPKQSLIKKSTISLQTGSSTLQAQFTEDNQQQMVVLHIPTKALLKMASPGPTSSGIAGSANRNSRRSVPYSLKMMRSSKKRKKIG